MEQTPKHGPGWYEEPSMPGTLRYWDGEKFTGDIAPKPLAAPPASSGPSLLTIGLGVASGIALVLVVIIWLSGGFAGEELCQPGQVSC